MIIVVDASVTARAALAGGWPAPFRRHSLAAPSLLWSEATAAIRQQAWRGEISGPIAMRSVDWLASAPVTAHDSSGLIVAAHELARTLGWAKSYDAEYVVLAQRLGASLFTVDARLARAVTRFVTIVEPLSL